ncbi:MAG: hypothetical protein M3245_05590 [Actinomycetota bacterium]|nr:hypothetical protein [Actinomycetota bacterium]
MLNEGELFAERLRIALQLHDEGVLLMRQNLRRRNPEAGEEEIQRRLGEWLSERPGAELGDAQGVPVSWPRG